MNILALQTWWRQLPQRDRTLLALWLGFMGVGILAWGWWALQNMQTSTQALLAVERQTLGRMQAQAEELQRLRQLPAAGGDAVPAQPGPVAASLSKFSLPSDLIQPQSDSRQFELQGTVPFDKWVEWTAFVQKDMRLALRKARVTRADRPGFVGIQATLEATENTP